MTEWESQQRVLEQTVESAKEELVNAVRAQVLWMQMGDSEKVPEERVRYLEEALEKAQTKLEEHSRQVKARKIIGYVLLHEVEKYLAQGQWMIDAGMLVEELSSMNTRLRGDSLGPPTLTRVSRVWIGGNTWKEECMGIPRDRQSEQLQAQLRKMAEEARSSLPTTVSVSPAELNAKDNGANWWFSTREKSVTFPKVNGSGIDDVHEIEITWAASITIEGKVWMQPYYREEFGAEVWYEIMAPRQIGVIEIAPFIPDEALKMIKVVPLTRPRRTGPEPWDLDPHFVHPRGEHNPYSVYGLLDEVTKFRKSLAF